VRVIILEAAGDVREVHLPDCAQVAQAVVANFEPSPLFDEGSDLGAAVWTECPPWTDASVNVAAAKLFDLAWAVVLDAGLDAPRRGRNVHNDPIMPRGMALLLGSAYHRQLSSWTFYDLPHEITLDYIRQLPDFRAELDDWDHWTPVDETSDGAA
jgi:hypothetical protein